MGKYSIFLTPQSIAFYVIVFFMYFYGFQRGWRISQEFLRQKLLETDEVENVFISPYHVYSSFFNSLNYDANDGQWRAFRRFFVITAYYLMIFVILSRIFRLFGHRVHSIFHLLVSFYFMKYNHNHYCFPLLIFFVFNYVMTIYVLRGRYRLTFIYIWCYAIGSLYFVDAYGREVFDHLLFDFVPTYTSFIKDYFTKSLTLLHWVVMFDLLLLRMISFSLDYAYYHKSVSEKKSKKKVWYCDIDRRTFSDDILNLSDYNFIHYFNFVFYPPLYMSGPVMTFNCFVSYYHKPNFPSIKYAIIYFFRFLISFLAMDISLHIVFIYSILKTPKFFLQFSGFDWACVAVWTVRIVWLKYNTFFKFFRFFSMIDGFTPYEDVETCYWKWKDSVTFWKEYHASIRKWTMRYVYFPLGGSRVGSVRKYANIIAVFMFIGFWHDLEWKLMGWAILASVLFVPELLIIKYEKSQKVPIRLIWGGNWMWVKAFYLWLLQFGFMSCFLIGFGLGWERTAKFWKVMFQTSEGWAALFLCWYVFRFGYPLMLRIREFQDEKERKRRKEIDEKFKKE